MTTHDVPSTEGTEVVAGRMEKRGRDLGRRADDAAARLEDGLDSAAEHLDAAREHLRQGVVAARQRVRSELRSGRARAEREVQERPLRTLLIAFGAGALVAMLLGRRRPRG